MKEEHSSLQQPETKPGHNDEFKKETGDGSLSPFSDFSEKGDREPSPVSLCFFIDDDII